MDILTEAVRRNRYYLSISGLSILIDTDRCLPEQHSFRPFLTSQPEADPDFVGIFRKVPQLPQIPGSIVPSANNPDILYEGNCFRVHTPLDEYSIRSFYDVPRDDTPYAVAYANAKYSQAWIRYLGKGSRCVSEMGNSFFHLGFEAVLIHNQRLCLHAACVDTKYGGLLFTGPSGIGKSTQATLWGQYRNGRQINGDRPILSKSGSGWLAWGSPYAGSSEIHVNESCPVSAIVLLRQNSRCTVRRLGDFEAFQTVWKGLTVYTWDTYFCEQASSLAMELIAQVPVFELSCTADEHAVRCLEKALQKEDDGNVK